MSELKTKTLERLNQMGASPKRSLGQNFLIADEVVEKIVSAVEKIPADQVIEIGPGLGALTDRLREFPRPMKVIELDRKFAEFWRAEGLEVVEADALDLDWRRLLNSSSVIVSNLPYQISSRLILDLSFVDAPLRGMVFMFQREVADRILSRPRSKEYGLLSVIAQTYWDVSAVCKVGPQAFLPPPQVGSRVLMFRPRTSLVGRDASFLSFVKAAFSQRRKYLIKNLGSFVDRDWRGLVENLGKKAEVRAEELSPLDFEHLFLSAK